MSKRMPILPEDKYLTSGEKISILLQLAVVTVFFLIVALLAKAAFLSVALLILLVIIGIFSPLPYHNRHAVARTIAKHNRDAYLNRPCFQIDSETGALRHFASGRAADLYNESKGLYDEDSPKFRFNGGKSL